MNIAPSNSKAGFLATLATAVVASIASSLCCIGPLIYLVFGVSAASVAGIEQYSWLQFPMLFVSTSLILSGLWRLYFSKRPICTGRWSRKKMRILYWFTVPVVLVFQLYPYLLPWLLEYSL